MTCSPAIDDVIDNLPDEIADAQAILDRAAATIADGEAEAGRILGEARNTPAALAQHSEVVRVAHDQAAQLLAEAEEEATALRRETDEFIDQRMAGFESVLHKTASQVDGPVAAGRAQRPRRLRPRRPTRPRRVTLRLRQFPGIPGMLSL